MISLPTKKELFDLFDRSDFEMSDQNKSTLITFTMIMIAEFYKSEGGDFKCFWGSYDNCIDVIKKSICDIKIQEAYINIFNDIIIRFI